MKNKHLINMVAVGLVSVFLMSCTTGSNSSSLSSATSSEFDSQEEQISEVREAIKNIKEGFKLEGKGILVEKDGNSNFAYEYKYLNKDEEGFSNRVAKIYEDDPEDVLIDETYFKDEKGNIYQEALGLDNVVKKEIKNSSIYDSMYINPFTLLNEDDFNLESEGKYSVDTHKISFILDKFLSMNNKVVSAFITIKDKKFVSLEVQAKEAFEDSFYVSQVTGNFSYDGVELNHLKPLEENDAQKKLTTALKNVGDTYVVDFINHKDSVHQKIYMSGKSIFVQHDFAASAIDEWQDSWWNSIVGEKGLTELYYMADSNTWGDNRNSYDTYDEAIPHFDIISGALFKHDELRDVFALESEYADVVASRFVPKMLNNEVAYKSGLKIEMSLENDKLKNVHFISDDCDIEMIISAFDKLPFGIVDEAISL